MKCALIQMDIKFEDIEANKEKIKNIVHEVSTNNVRIAFFPEMTCTGFTMQQMVDDHILSFMQDLSCRYDMALGYGNIIEGYYNVFDIVDKGNLVCRYKKIHPFLKESEYYAKGEEIVCATIDDLTFVPSICFDLRFPILYALAKDKGDVLVNIASWPSDRSMHWDALLKARAIENQRYVLGINRVGTDPNCHYNGHSIAYDGWGTALNEITEQEDIIYIDIEKKEYPADFIACERKGLYKKMME